MDQRFGPSRDDGTRPLRERSGLAIAALILSLLILVLEVVDDLVEISVSARLEAGGLDGEFAYLAVVGVEDRAALIAVFGVPAALFAIFTFISWLHAASENVRASRAIGAGGWSPGWAIGGWFLPVANVLVTYGVLREVWACSRLQAVPAAARPSGRRAIMGDPVMAWSLAFWGGGLVCVTAAVMASVASGDALRFRAAAWVGIAGEVLLILAALLAIRIVRVVTDLQHRATSSPATGGETRIGPVTCHRISARRSA